MLDFLEGLDMDERVLIDPSRTAAVVEHMLGGRAVDGESPVAMMKSRKNDVQIEGIPPCDGARRCRACRGICRD